MALCIVCAPKPRSQSMTDALRTHLKIVCAIAACLGHKEIVHRFKCGPLFWFKRPASAKLFIHTGAARGRLWVEFTAVDKYHDVWVALDAVVGSRPVRVDLYARDAKTPHVTCGRELLVRETFWGCPSHGHDTRRAVADTHAHVWSSKHFKLSQRNAGGFTLWGCSESGCACFMQECQRDKRAQRWH